MRIRFPGMEGNVFGRSDPGPIDDLRRRHERARRRVAGEMPYSPAWDAAMALLEDRERELWRIEHDPPTEEGRRWALKSTRNVVRESTVRA